MFKPAHIAIVGMVGTYTMLWGFWVAAPWWSVFGTAQLYASMLGLAPEISWGATALIIGAATCYGAAKHAYLWTRWAGSLIWAFWLIVGLLYLAGDWHNTGGITALFFAAYGAYIFINTKLNKELFVHRSDKGVKKKYE